MLDLGIVVDPDVDRLAFVCEDGSVCLEKNILLVACADFVLSKTPGSGQYSNSKLSSSSALRDVTEKHGWTHTSLVLLEK